MSLYEIAVPTFTHTLTSLRAILKKAEDHATTHKIEPSVLVSARLFPDMLPLSNQVQIATDSARRGCARLAGIDAPVFEDTETTFAELYARIDGTLSFLATLKPEQFEGAESRDYELPVPGGKMTLNGVNLLMGYAMANFSFHVVTAYNILRHNGVVIGKYDYLGAS